MTAFDYIVVGSSSAGAVVAGRLSEDPAVTVLLIEAGASKRSMHVRIPAAFVGAHLPRCVHRPDGHRV